MNIIAFSPMTAAHKKYPSLDEKQQKDTEQITDILFSATESCVAASLRSFYVCF